MPAILRPLLLAAAVLAPTTAAALHYVEGPEFHARAEAAEELVRRRAYEAAFEAFTALTRQATTPEGKSYAWLRRAELLERPGWWRRAREAHTEAEAALSGTPAAVTARYHVAVIDYEHLGRGPQALEALDGLMRAHPGSIHAIRALTRLAWEIEPGAPRVAFYRATYEVLGGSRLGPVILWRCGEAAQAAELWWPALACYRRLVQGHPRSVFVADALFQAAGVYRRLGLGEPALTLYRELLSLGRPPPEDPFDFFAPLRSAVADDVWLGMGDVQRELVGDLGAAEHAYEELLRLFPTSRLRDDALYRLGEVRAAMGRAGKARAAWTRLLEAHPGSRWTEEARLGLDSLPAGPEGSPGRCGGLGPFPVAAAEARP